MDDEFEEFQTDPEWLPSNTDPVDANSKHKGSKALSTITEESRIYTDRKHPQPNQSLANISEDFVSGAEGFARLQSEEEYRKDNRIIRDDPRFQHSFHGREHSWEPTPPPRCPIQQNQPNTPDDGFSFVDEPQQMNEKENVPVPRSPENRILKNLHRSPPVAQEASYFGDVSTPMPSENKKQLRRDLHNQFKDISAIGPTTSRRNISPSRTITDAKYNEEGTLHEVQQLSETKILAAVKSNSVDICDVLRKLRHRNERPQADFKAHIAQPVSSFKNTLPDVSRSKILEQSKSRMPPHSFGHTKLSVINESRPESAASAYSASQSYCSSGPVLEITPAKLIFGFVSVDVDSILPITIQNKQSEDVWIKLRLQNENYFSLCRFGKSQRMLRASETIVVEATFKADPKMNASVVTSVIIAEVFRGSRIARYEIPLYACPRVANLTCESLSDTQLSITRDGNYVATVANMQNFALKINCTGRSAFALVSVSDESGNAVDCTIFPGNRITLQRKTSLILSFNILEQRDRQLSSSMHSLASTTRSPQLTVTIVWGEEIALQRVQKYARQHRSAVNVAGINIEQPFKGSGLKYDVPAEWPLSKFEVPVFENSLRTTRIFVNSKKTSRSRVVCSNLADETLLVARNVLNQTSAPSYGRAIIEDPDATVVPSDRFRRAH